ncbi:MAG: hypothetical protein CL843_16900 [Crocinitomicaceae bacterium]|nr:hypothetical protein [Crocinitomicaceae bacterium]|tara:strand:- start:379 stop:1029 length:651 start_codon:yes stop_codon:yes gene_type:complete
MVVVLSSLTKTKAKRRRLIDKTLSLNLFVMKKFIALFILFVSGSAIYAQSPFDLGVKAGGNYSVFYSDADGFSSNGNVSYTGGVFARLRAKRLSAQAEILYVGVNGKGKYEIEGQEFEADFVFSNLDLPLMVGYKFIDAKVLKFRLNGGVIQSFNLTQGGDLVGDDFEDGYTNVALGVSADIPLLVFDVRYQHPLGEFYDEIQAGLITLTVGVKFF